MTRKRGNAENRDSGASDGAESTLSTESVKRQLLDLVPGVTNTLNGVPVKRLPCAGFWFEVASCWEPHDVHWQRLRFADAVSRVKSGHYPRLQDPPDMRKYYARLREESRLQRNAELAQGGDRGVARSTSRNR